MKTNTYNVKQFFTSVSPEDDQVSPLGKKLGINTSTTKNYV